MKSTAPPKPIVAVFDFDGTLIDTDVAYQFINAFIKRPQLQPKENHDDDLRISRIQRHRLRTA